MINLEEKKKIILEAAEDKLASDIVSLNIGDMTTIADYFIIMSGNSVNQTQAIAEEIEFKLEEAGFEQRGKEGLREGQWIILDFNDIVIHVFHKEMRDYYNLEKLWTKENINN